MNPIDLLFFWIALDHISLTDSYLPASNASDFDNVWDAYHLNAVGLTDKPHEIIVSGRNTWTVYKIDKQNGAIIWYLGGKQNEFAIASGGHFSWQHDPHLLPNNRISIFDDNCCESSTVPPDTPSAHGLALKLNFDRMTAMVNKTYFHDPLIHVSSQGSVQNLKNGNKFIGWGSAQYFSEYKKGRNSMEDPASNTVYDAQIPGNNISYRAFRNKWVGKPYYPPSIAVDLIEGSLTVCASWNGFTQTTAWRILAGRSPSCLSNVKTVEKSGFETAIKGINNRGPYYQLKALNKKGKVIGKSELVKIVTNTDN